MSMCAITFKREMMADCKHAQLRRHRDLMQNAVDAITNAQIVLERLDVNVGGALDDRFADDLIDEFHDRSFRIVRIQIGAGFRVLQHFERAVGLENLVECLRAHAVKRFHRAQNLGARHQHPFGRFFQKLSTRAGGRRN